MTISASFLGVSVPTPAFETGATDILNGGGLSQPEKPGAAAPPLAIRRRDSPVIRRQGIREDESGWLWAQGGVGGCDRAGSRVRARAAKLQPERRPRWSLIRFPAGDRLGAAPIRFGRQRTGRPAAESAARNRSGPGGRAREGPTAHRAQRTRCASRGAGRTPGRSRSMRSGKPMSL
jgi:hypothetical protein